MTAPTGSRTRASSGAREPAPTAVLHHFSVDVEEYFQVSAFERYVDRAEWDTYVSRVRYGVDRLLGLLERYDAHGTFFVLGWIAERHPTMIQAIAEAGHEIASHGWDHRRVTELTAAEFRETVRRSKERLEDLTGVAVDGFRAPSFSIVPGLEWALDILIEEGYRYDSSLFPVRRSGYGYPGGRRDPHWIERPGGRLAEIPPATLRVAGVNLPAGGGGYLRLLPRALFRTAIRSAARRGVPATLYTHPWELDPEQPRLDVRWLTRLRHYGGLYRTARRLEQLLAECRFRPMRETVATL